MLTPIKICLSLCLLVPMLSQAETKAKPTDFFPECTSECGGIDWTTYEQCAKPPKKHAKVPALKNDPSYHHYRQQLIAAGWLALRTKPKPVDPEDADVWAGAELWKAGYKELEYCSGSGLAPCAFRFVDKEGNHLRVHTQGEESTEYQSEAGAASTEFLCAPAS